MSIHTHRTRGDRVRRGPGSHTSDRKKVGRRSWDFLPLHPDRRPHLEPSPQAPCPPSRLWDLSREEPGRGIPLRRTDRDT